MESVFELVGSSLAEGRGLAQAVALRFSAVDWRVTLFAPPWMDKASAEHPECVPNPHASVGRAAISSQHGATANLAAYLHERLESIDAGLLILEDSVSGSLMRSIGAEAYVSGDDVYHVFPARFLSQSGIAEAVKASGAAWGQRGFIVQGRLPASESRELAPACLEEYAAAVQLVFTTAYDGAGYAAVERI